MIKLTDLVFLSFIAVDYCDCVENFYINVPAFIMNYCLQNSINIWYTISTPFPGSEAVLSRSGSSLDLNAELFD